MLNTSQLRSAWAPPCSGPFAIVTLFGGARISVRPAIVPAVKALDAVFRKYNYRATPPDCGAFNCRRITGGSGYSLHAYAIAADINWQDNGYGPTLVTDMPRAMVNEIKALRTGNGKQVWGWGGDYRNNRDAMHYEIVCSPADLATGIRNVTPPVPPASAGKWVPFRPGDTAAEIVARGGKKHEILELQMLLTNIAQAKRDIGYDPKGCDDSYGPGSQSAVRYMKAQVNKDRKRRGLPLWTVDANVGPTTIDTARWLNALI